MQEEPGILRVKPWGKDQGEYVRINEADFDPSFHQLLDAADKPAKEVDTNGDGKVTAAELKAALTEKGIAFRGNASKAELQALLDAADKPAE